jgi:beta-ribofuranosylaminobenzene 5'-phosphate synthase
MLNGDAVAMTEAVHIRTPCRLHFGMFSFGHPSRPQFGGVGALVDPPAVDVEIKPAAHFHVTGSLSERAEQFAQSAAAAWQLPMPPPCQISVRAPSDHIGLGVGTQLGLAIAGGLRRFLQLPEITVEALASAVGRAGRSAVGTYGFQQGGLIVDAGHLVGWAPPTTAQGHASVGGAHPTRLQRRLALPGEWRFVLVRPANQRGLAGATESDAFARLPPVPDHVTRELWRIADDQLLPAAECADCNAFGEAVYQFGRLAGECFAAVQGGPFASGEIAGLVAAIRARGIPGVGQSSWGPTVFAICSSQSEAEVLDEWLRHQLAAGSPEISIASPNNEGAIIR